MKIGDTIYSLVTWRERVAAGGEKRKRGCSQVNLSKRVSLCSPGSAGAAPQYGLNHIEARDYILMYIKKLIDPDDELWTIRRGAVATIRLFISHSRYMHGEAVIETSYRLPCGADDQDPTSRIWLGASRREIVTQLYDKLLDAVLIARQYDTQQVVIDFQTETLGEWTQDFRVTVIIVSHELEVPVSGIIIPEVLAHPGRLLTLSDDLSWFLFGEEDDSY